MDCWEHLVIHINVEPPKPAPTEAQQPAAPPSSDAAAANPLFSESFLKKEFPKFYEVPADIPPQGQPQHPAQQLQAFLNTQGSQGWELVGVFPVGTLTMMFFRRPKSAASDAPTTTAESPIPVATPTAEQPSLEAMHTRLQDLEQRLQAALAAAAKPTTAGSRMPASSIASARTGVDQSPPLAMDLVVSPSRLAELADATPVPSSVAAQAIGLRSATSLANHGARYGYNPGLSKVGPNGMVAIYTGPGAAEGGGKERRLWIVVPQERLAR